MAHDVCADRYDSFHQKSIIQYARKMGQNHISFDAVSNLRNLLYFVEEYGFLMLWNKIFCFSTLLGIAKHPICLQYNLLSNKWGASSLLEARKTNCPVYDIGRLRKWLENNC